ncbi:hypothetical protein E5358_07050 [Palleniella muris]|uniref:Uncharacterized protein n=1 Tax=Palleniella muris TaxID=3038145 RepID=A0AC61QR18_9BACT|nr:hypothetical protein [Palleniella muris]TGX82518.1 hypothetical protein E5358_07050 [Palleniella muris]
MKNIILILLLLLSTTGSPAQIPKRYDTENYKRAMEAINKAQIRDEQQFADLVKEYRQKLTEERKEAENQL